MNSRSTSGNDATIAPTEGEWMHADRASDVTQVATADAKSVLRLEGKVQIFRGGIPTKKLDDCPACDDRLLGCGSADCRFSDWFNAQAFAELDHAAIGQRINN